MNQSAKALMPASLPAWSNPIKEPTGAAEVVYRRTEVEDF
jgi:hypothetical protein